MDIEIIVYKMFEDKKIKEVVQTLLTLEYLKNFYTDKELNYYFWCNYAKR